MHGVAGFLGVEETDKQATRWENRRKRYAGSIGKLKDKYVKPQEGLDELDGSKYIRDPLRKPSGRSTVSVDRSGMPRRSLRKSSVAHMAFKGVGNLVVSSTVGFLNVVGSLAFVSLQCYCLAIAYGFSQTQSLILNKCCCFLHFLLQQNTLKKNSLKVKFC